MQVRVSDARLNSASEFAFLPVTDVLTPPRAY
jgi:hypothetical protein